MALVTEKTGLHSDRFTGKFSEPNGYGHAIYGKTRYGSNDIQAGVYQYQNGAKGKVLSRHRDNYPTKSNSEGAQRRRLMMRNGMLAWQALDTETKREYNSRKYPPSMTGHNRFLKEYLKANH
jgi:hypothetical protein